MTVHVTAYIVCDWCKSTLPSTHSEASARDAAHARGWRRRKRKNGSMGDACPSCVKLLEVEARHKIEPIV